MLKLMVRIESKVDETFQLSRSHHQNRPSLPLRTALQPQSVITEYRTREQSRYKTQLIMTDQSVAGPSSLVRAASDLSISSDSTCTPASEPKSPGFDVESNQSLDGGDGSTNTSPDDETGQTSKGKLSRKVRDRD